MTSNSIMSKYGKKTRSSSILLNYSRSKKLFVNKKDKQQLHDNDSDMGGDDEQGIDLSELMGGGGDDKKVFRKDNHIYYRTDVTMGDVNRLCNMIDDYNKECLILSRECEYGIIIHKPLYLHITSMGGDMHAGFLAYDHIKNSNIPIYTIGEGYTVSSGSIMFMAGARRFMTKHSYFLAHQLSNTFMGTQKFMEIEDEIQNSTEFMTKLYHIYLDNIRHAVENVSAENKLTLEIVKEHMRHDIFWDFDTCFRYGLVDELYTNFVDAHINDIKRINDHVHTGLKNSYSKNVDPKYEVVNVDIVKKNDPTVSATSLSTEISKAIAADLANDSKSKSTSKTKSKGKGKK